MDVKSKHGQLKRIHFETSRSLDFFSKKELIAQTGHQTREWLLVILKELLDNSLDACEESAIGPEIQISVDDDSITVTDNGPGIPEKVIASVLDFTIRVSSREAYVSPSRGAQGNALKTIIAMPFALCGEGRLLIESQGICHKIEVSVDRIRQQPVVTHEKTDSPIVEGTRISLQWDDEKASLIQAIAKSHFLQNGNDPDDFDDDEKARLIGNLKSRFLQFAEDFTWINPHLSLNARWGDDETNVVASDQTWEKWLPSNPTDPAWYGVDELERLIAAHICHNPEKTIREFVSEFRGLSGTAKQKTVIASLGMARVRLMDLVTAGILDKKSIARLLDAMKTETKPVKPPALGIVGKDHLQARCESVGGDPKSFRYQKAQGTDNGLPWIIETCFAYCPKEERGRRIVTGVNFSAGIINPFRQLGPSGESLDAVLREQRAGAWEPTVLVLHMTCPRVSYADRGKSSVVVED